MSKQPTFFKKPEQPMWATECEGRYPRFKVHAKLGHAKNAVSNRQSDWSSFPSPDWDNYSAKRVAIDVYEWVDGECVHHPEMGIGPETHEFTEHRYTWNDRVYYRLRRKEVSE